MADLTLIIGNKNYSSWSLRPWFFMQFHQMGFEEIRVPLFTKDTDQQLSAYNSDSKVPVLQDGDLTVWDTLAIMEYLSETYLDNKGWPQDRKSRAFARSISAEMHSSYSHIRNELPMNCRKNFTHILPSAEALREINRITHLWASCRQQHSNAGPWLFGGFSIADAMFAPIALRFNGYNINLSDEAQSYVELILNHPAIKKWIESGKQELEVITEDEVEI